VERLTHKGKINKSLTLRGGGEEQVRADQQTEAVVKKQSGCHVLIHTTSGLV
jgi:hypothetical protein